MLKYLPDAQPTTRHKIINTIVAHLKAQVSYIPRVSGITGDITILDHGINEYCPKGVTFIFPVGALEFDPPDWQPHFERVQDNNGSRLELTNPPKLLMRLPDLVYRIDPDNHIIGAGMMARETAAYLNKVYCTERND